jgi:hypothetical protein
MSSLVPRVIAASSRTRSWEPDTTASMFKTNLVIFYIPCKVVDLLRFMLVNSASEELPFFDDR